MPGAVAADDGGMTDRFALVRTGLLLALLLAPLPATADQDADARAALARYVEVTGGRAAFLGDTSVHVRGRLADASLGGRFESWAAWPARYAQTEQLGTIRTRQGSDGDAAWRTDLTSRKVTVLEGKDREALLGEAWFANEQWAREDLGGGKILLGQSAFMAGRAMRAVEVIPPTGNRRYLWFDGETGLLDRITHFRDQHTWIETLSGWKTLAGRKRATLLTMGEKQWPETYRELKVDSVWSGTPIANSVFSPPASNLRPISWLKGKGVARIPFRYRSGAVWIRASVNGGAMADFILDTGCSLSAFDKTYARNTGLELEGTMVAQGVGGYDTGGFAQIRTLRVAAASGDGVEIRDLKVAVLELQNEMQTFDWNKPAGLIGYDFLSRFVVDLDFDQRILTLYEPATYVYTGGGQALPMTLHSNIPTVEITLDGGCTGRFIVDVGNAFVLSVNAGQIEKCGLFGGTRKQLQQWGSGIGGSFPVSVCRMDSVRLGPFGWTQPIVGLTTYRRGGLGSKEIQGNIGTSVLQRFHCTFDYSRGQLWLEPGQRYPEKEGYSRSGLFVTRWSGRIYVAGVVRKSPGDVAGLKPRDVLKRVNGKPIEGFTQEQLERLLEDSPVGTLVTLTIERDLRDQTLEVTLADIL